MAEPTKVLLVEDNPGDIELIRVALAELPAGQFEIVCVDRLQSAIAGLAADRAMDVVLLDLGLPDSQGLETLVALKQRCPDVPIVVLTARDDQALALGALGNGAQDYLVKGKSDGELLRRSLLYAIARRRARAAEDALRARDEFLSIASHELRTPLTALVLQLQGVRRMAQGLASERAVFFDKIDKAVRSTDRLSKLIDTLLDLSRISIGQLDLNLEPINLSALVREVAEHFVGETLQLSEMMKISVPHEVTGEWDRLRMEQVLSNLFSNAVKYGGGKPIEVDLMADQGRVQLSVRDQGIGIAPGDVARIFSRFERAVPVRHYGGFGLGLYITRQIVERHGGQIGVTSVPGAGSTFTVEMPRHPSAVAADQN